MKASLPGSLKGLVAVIVALALTPALLLMAYSGYSDIKGNLDEIRRAALQSARTVARQQTLLAENTRVLLLSLSGLAEIRNADLEASSALFRKLVLYAPAYADIRLCNANGDTLASSSRDSAAPDEDLRRHVRAVFSKSPSGPRRIAWETDPDASRLTGLLQVRRNERAAGVLAASIIIPLPAEELSRLDGDGQRHLYIVDRRGRLILTHTYGTGAEPVEAPSLWREALASPLRHGLLPNNGSEAIAFEKIFFTEDGKEPDLTVFVRISTPAILSRVLAPLLKGVLLLFGATVFAFAVTWMLCRVSLRVPVRNLLDAANRIRKGDLSTRVPGGFMVGELELLAESFNGLMQAIEIKERELAAARDAATASGAAKGEFLANMSHEIRTPMNAILGMAYLAKNSGLTERQRNYLENIQEEAEKLLSIINDILDFSKIEAGKVHIETVPFSLSELLRDILRTAEEEARRAAVRFSSFLERDLPESLDGDPLHLSQALAAVLSHALKHAGRGEVNFRCRRADDEESDLALLFSITCAGDDKTRRKFFESFTETYEVQGHADQESAQRLSLAIARNLVHLMRGVMDLDPESGKDAAVRIRLPFSAGAQGMGGRAGSAPGTGPEGSVNLQENARPPADLKNVRILLVEDNLINQQIAEEILTNAGATVRIASNGLEALAMLDEMPRGAPYHIVLMDLQMPELDGFAATRRLRLDERFKNLPVIAMTAHAMSNEWRQCREVGMNHYLAKPINVRVLLEAIGKWIRVPQPVEASGGEDPPAPLSGTATASGGDRERRPALPPLPGVDSAAALARLAGNTRLYVKTVCMFLKSIPLHERELSEAFELEDTQRLRRAAHTVKGLAATVGATELSALAAAMEREIGDTGNLPASAALETLKTSLAALSEAIAASGLCAPDSSPAPDDSAAGSEQIPCPEGGVTLKQALATLEELLESSDGGAPDYFADQAGVFAAGLPPEVRASLEKSLQEFDYDQALQIIKDTSKN